MIKQKLWNFPGSSVVKNPPAKKEMEVWSLGREDSPEKEMAAYCSILAGKSHGQRSLTGSESVGSQSQTWLSDKTTTTKTFQLLSALLTFIRSALCGTPLVVQWLRVQAPKARTLGLIPGQGTRFHMPQLRIHMPQLRLSAAKQIGTW